MNLTITLFELDIYSKYENWIDIFSISTDSFHASLLYIQFRNGSINNIDILYSRDLIRKIRDIMNK